MPLAALLSQTVLELLPPLQLSSVPLLLGASMTSLGDATAAAADELAKKKDIS